MTAGAGGPRPPRLAEKLLERMVGADPRGRSILGDAREELAERRAGGGGVSAALWYWTYVLRFALTYGSGEGGASGRLGLRFALRQAARGLIRRPAFSGAVVATLGLGIGATTLGFALVDGVLLRPLPYPEPDQLIHLSRVSPDWFGAEPTAGQAGGVFATPVATFFDWERRSRVFQHLGAYAGDSGILQGEGTPVQVSGASMTSGAFAALGVSPLRGRPILPEDEAASAQPVVVVSHGLWMRRFGGDPGVVGSSVVLDGLGRTVVGIMPETFAFPDESTDYWVPLSEANRQSQRRDAGFLHAVGRLAPGFGLAEARSDLLRVTEEMAAVHPEEREFKALVFPLQEVMVANVRSGLLLLMGAALVVLLVGCANVTNLFLARSAERRREFAVHAALGAGSRRLAGMVLGESLILMGLGGIVGLVLARVALNPFVAWLPARIPRAQEITVDGRIALVTLVLTAALGVLVALLPALQTGRSDLNATLRDGGRGSSGGVRVRSRGTLIVTEVALAVLLLSASGLFLESYRISTSTDLGFGKDDALSFYLSVPELWEADGERRRVFFDDLIQRLEGLPGVTTVAAASQMPFNGWFSRPPAGVETGGEVEETILHSSVVTPAYFEAMDIPLLEGRLFDSGDVERGEPVTVVSQALARQYWPGEDPLGKRVRIGAEEDGVWHEVIGVVGNVRYWFAGPEVPEFYRSAGQYPVASARLVVEADPGVAGVDASVVDVMRDVLPGIPVSVMSLATRFRTDRDYRWARIASILLTGLGGTAALLAILGIYGVLSYAVLQKTRDIGIQVSLGGTAGVILRSVLGPFVALAGVGVVVGLGLALATGSVLRAALIGEAPTGPWILVGVSLVVLATVAVASLVPAIRALRVDPLVAFRAD